MMLISPPALTVYTDFVCPWCYIGDMYLRDASTKRDFDIHYVMFPLHPETPSSGLTLNKLFKGRFDNLQKVQDAIRKQAIALGLRYGTRTHTYNSLNAQIIGKALSDPKDFELFKLAVFEKYFGDGCNIGDSLVLQQILDNINNRKWNAIDLINDADLQQQVEQDWILCRTNGITGVPTFQQGDRYCFGVQQTANILNLLFPE